MSKRRNQDVEIELVWQRGQMKGGVEVIEGTTRKKFESAFNSFFGDDRYSHIRYRRRNRIIESRKLHPENGDVITWLVN